MNATQLKTKSDLDPNLYRDNPEWFRGAVAYRLLKLMTPKRISSRLPRVLQIPLLPPGLSLPKGYQLPDPFPAGLSLPPGTWFPPGWVPGNPLPDGYLIDTSLFFPDGWTYGDPLPPGLILSPGTYLPAGWETGDFLPADYFIDTALYFQDGWSPGDPPPGTSIPDPVYPPWIPQPGDITPPTYIFPWEPGPPNPNPSPQPGTNWTSMFNTDFWSPGIGSFNASQNRWEPGGEGRIELSPVGTWSNLFRPSMIRLTLSQTILISVDIYAIFETPMNKILEQPHYMSLAEQPIFFLSGSALDDIGTMVLELPFYLLNIEFV